MDKSQCKWVYPASDKNDRYTRLVCDVDDPDAESVWIVDEEFQKQHFKDVEKVWFVEPHQFKFENRPIEKVYVAGCDPWYEETSWIPKENMPERLLHKWRMKNYRDLLNPFGGGKNAN